MDLSENNWYRTLRSNAEKEEINFDCLGRVQCPTSSYLLQLLAAKALSVYCLKALFFQYLLALKATLWASVMCT